ncbi:MAG: CBS domain-containing protein [Proteobacteria bacterium]|nr:CBS domain-containing protein [Pseudomonadota bacterium]
MKPVKKDWRNWLVDLLGLKPEDREALKTMLKQQGGFVTPEEVKMIEGVLEMREWKIRDIMLPFNDVVSMKITDNYQQAVDKVCEWQHSRYPVVDGSGEVVLGILLAKDLLHYTKKPDAFNLQQAMRDALSEPDSKSLDKLLEDFRSNRSHMVIVHDEYKQTVGVVTIEDLLERIVGEIEDESDEAEDRDITPHADGGATVKGTLSIEEFNQHFNSQLPANGADTIGGWLAAMMGRMPKAGDRYEKHGFIFKITAASERRIHHLDVQCPPS